MHLKIECTIFCPLSSKIFGVLQLLRIKFMGINNNEVKVIGGELKKDNNAQEIGIFTELPFPFLPGHDEFLISHKLLVAKKSD